MHGPYVSCNTAAITAGRWVLQLVADQDSVGIVASFAVDSMLTQPIEIDNKIAGGSCLTKKFSPRLEVSCDLQPKLLVLSWPGHVVKCQEEFHGKESDVAS